MAHQRKYAPCYSALSSTLRFGLVLVLLFAAVAPSQAQKVKKFSKQKEVKLADYAFRTGNYYTAIELYQRILERDTADRRMAYQTAECYRYVRDYEQAAYWYSYVVNRARKKFIQARLHHGSMLKMQGRYNEAKKEFLQFKKEYRGPNSGPYRRMAGNESLSCDFAKVHLSDPHPVKVTHLDSKINRVNSEFAPMPFKGGLVFASLPSDTIIVLENGSQDPPRVDLYYSRKDGRSWSDPLKFDIGPFNKKGHHTANGVMSRNGLFFYFTRCKENDAGKTICSIWRSDKIDGSWTEPRMLPEPVNSKSSSSTQPAIWTSFDGTREILYFSSDRPGGKGGYDLWYMDIRKGVYRGIPRNLGRKINTYGDEVTPFYDQDNGILYFSSNGLHSFGGLDVFKTEGGGSSWSTPENMGAPINTSVDDFYYTLENNSEGYMVSNRKGGASVKSETCCDDIYSFKWTNVFHLAVTGMTYDVGLEDTMPSDLKQLVGAKVILIVTDKAGTQKTEVLASLDSTGIFKSGKLVGKKYFFNLGANVDLGAEHYYKLIAKKEGYLNASAKFNTIDIEGSDTLEVDLFLKKIPETKTFALRNIYYDFDKSSLRLISEEELNNLKDILNANPEIIVEIGSHTDNKGTEEYNARLSQKRAESVVKFLIENGIDPQRLAAKGYGESKPVALNENPDGSDNPEGRQKNRRTEFRIIGELEGSAYLEYLD